MRLAGTLIVITLASGCLRFGYDERPAPRDPKRDAAVVDAATTSVEAAVDDADASIPDAWVRDTAVTEAAGDASSPEDAGGVPNDAAPPDEDGGTDDDASVGSALCPDRSDALFCDAFEAAALSTEAYRVITNGTVTQTTERARSGTGSLRAATTSSATRNPEARFGLDLFGNRTAGDLWLRSYYYLPSTVTVNRGFSTCVIGEIEPPYFGFSLLVRESRVEIAVGDTMYEGTTAFPRDRWTCVELHVSIDASAGYFEAYLDGALAVRSPATDTLPAMGYSSMDVGIHYAELNQGPVEVFVDDVVAGTTRVGCD